MKDSTYTGTGVGFKNFRKFTDFPFMKLGGITYLVGINNSGKFTLVKALLLILDFYNNMTEDKINTVFKTMWFNELYDARVRGIGR